ncbi:MAG: AAA family ATPase [Bdellovibrio sp.]
MIEEFISGTDLSQRLKQGFLSEKEGLSLASTIAQDLVVIHSHGFVHRDIKPRNLMIDLNGGFHLIDFGLASFSYETGAEQKMAGTLKYCSPEQAGSIQRPVDGRSDLYSLGVTLFECFAGRPPFESENNAELLKKHLSEVPAELRSIRPELSQSLSSIVAKLLAKDPDDRYLSAKDLLRDLLQVESLGIEHLDASFSPEKIGSKVLQIVGREKELNVMQNLWRSSSEPKFSMGLIEGASGVGKTTLIKTFAQSVRDKAGMTLSGKCVQGSNNLPFQPFREAIDNHLGYLGRSLSPERQIDFRNHLSRTLSQSEISLIREISSELDKCFEESFVRDNQRRSLEEYYEAITQFFLFLSSSSSGLMFFIDDIQWLDDASEAFLKYFANREAQKTILFVLASRNDPESVSKLQSIRQLFASSISVEIKLQPLNRDETESLISRILPGKSIQHGLTELIFNRGQGVPFASVQFLRGLLENGHLLPHWGEWRLRGQGLEKINLPENVIDMVLSRARVLSEEAKSFLRLAALWGSHFPEELIGQISNLSSFQIEKIRSEALRVGLIEAAETPGEFSFIHDKIQEAFSQSTKESDQTEFHRLISLTLAQKHFHPDLIIRCAESANKAKDKLPRQMLIETFFRATVQSGNAFAVSEAFKFSSWYLEQAGDYGFLQGDLGIGKHLNYSVELIEVLEVRGLSASLLGRHSEAVRVLSFLSHLPNLDSARRARIHYELTRIYVFRRQIDTAWEHTVKGLLAIGHWSNVKLLNGFRIISKILMSLVLEPFEAFLLQEKNTDKKEKWKIASQLAESGGITAYALNHPIKFSAIVFPAIFNGLRAKKSPETAFSFAASAAGFAAVGAFKLAKRYIGKSLSKANSLKDPFLLTRVQVLRGFVLQFSNEWEEALKLFADLLFRQRQFLSGLDLMNSAYALSTMTVLSGYHRIAEKALMCSLEYLNSVEFPGDERLGHPSLGTLIPTRAALGELSNLNENIRQAEIYLAKVQSDSCGNLGFIGSMFALFYETGDFWNPQIEDLEKRSRSFYFSPILCAPHFKFFFVFRAYIHLSRLLDKKNHRSKSAYYEKSFAKSLHDLNSSCRAPSWIPIQGHLHVLMGSWLLFKGRHREAFIELEYAIKKADLFDLPLVRFEAYRVLAEIYRTKNNIYTAEFYFASCLELSRRHGWLLKEQEIKKKLEHQERTGADKIGSLQDPTKKQGIQTEPQSLLESEIARESSGTRDPRQQMQLGLFEKITLNSVGIVGLEDQSRIILDAVIEFFSPDRALIFLPGENDEPMYLVGRSSAKEDIQFPENFSRKTIVEVIKQRKPLIFGEKEAREMLSSESFMASNLRSALVAPLIYRDKLIGILYLDNRLIKGLFREQDLSVVMSVTSILAAHMESARAAGLEIEKVKLNQDLHLAGAVQKLLLPADQTLRSQGLLVFGYHRSAAVAGGDWWWAETLKDNGLVAFVGDVTGHGPASAMVTSTVAGSFFMFREFMNNNNASGEAFAEAFSSFLKTVDLNLHRQTRGEYLIPFNAVYLNPSGSLWVWGSASPSAIVVQESPASSLTEVRSKKYKIQYADSCRTPLGSASCLTDPVLRVSNFRGSVFTYTDGLWEIPFVGSRLHNERSLGEQLRRCLIDEVSFPQFLESTIQAQLKVSDLVDDLSYVIVSNDPVILSEETMRNPKNSKSSEGGISFRNSEFSNGEKTMRSSQGLKRRYG